jgi:hypothetical protein
LQHGANHASAKPRMSIVSAEIDEDGPARWTLTYRDFCGDTFFGNDPHSMASVWMGKFRHSGHGNVPRLSRTLATDHGSTDCSVVAAACGIVAQAP